MGSMFKKLKQKIEEGGEGGIERVAFSPRKLPGVAVRSTSQSDQPPENAPSVVVSEDQPDDSGNDEHGVTVDAAIPSIRSLEQVAESVCDT